MWSTLHFSSLKLICHFCAQFDNLSRLSCNSKTCPVDRTVLAIFVSSSNFEIMHVRSSSISLIYIKNSSGPSTDPWGTPLVTLVHAEALPLMTTLCFLSVSQFSIHFNMLPLIPWAFSFDSSRLWGTLSKAFWKSRYIISTALFSSYWFRIS